MSGGASTTMARAIQYDAAKPHDTAGGRENERLDEPLSADLHPCGAQRNAHGLALAAAARRG